MSVSDAFLKEGIIVYTDGRLDDAKLRFNAKPTDVLDGAPIVVLVNGGSGDDTYKSTLGSPVFYARPPVYQSISEIIP